MATVAINNSVNAALLAAEILAIHDKELLKRLEVYLESQTSSVEEKANRLERLGFEKYASLQ